MLRKILLFAIVLIITGMIHSDSVSGYESPEMETSAKSFVLMEAGTRQVVTGKNENVRVPSGALNKLMTALIAAEGNNHSHTKGQTDFFTDGYRTYSL